MHAYLRSIGLTDDRITEKDIEKLCDRVYEKYDHMESVRDEDTKATFLEFSKELGKGFGLKVLGMQDSFGFHRTSYYPYVVGSDEGSDGSVGIQKKLMGDAFIGVCNDGHVGAPLIFTLQNPGCYLRGLKEDPQHESRVTTSFSALAKWGRILLPTRNLEHRLMETSSGWAEDRVETIQRAKMGDDEAMKELTVQNLELYGKAQDRIKDGEDILSVVDTYFIPYGMESDQYHILANIDRVREEHSSVTGEVVWKMLLNCGGLLFDACITDQDLEGLPLPGMRLKADIWMQGRINFLLPSAVS